MVRNNNMEDITRNKYDLIGTVVVTTWMGNKGWVKLHIITDEKGLKNILQNPRQDYIQFGVASVDYASFNIYKTEIKETDDKIIEVQYKEPVKTIEDGTLDLPDDSLELFLDDNNFQIVHW